jgi:hypothetical protein
LGSGKFRSTQEYSTLPDSTPTFGVVFLYPPFLYLWRMVDKKHSLLYSISISLFPPIHNQTKRRPT